MEKCPLYKGHFFVVQGEGLSYNIFMQKYLFDKAFMKKTLWIAIPLMAQQLISVSVNLIDNLMVGRLGDVSLSAVAAANRYFFVASAAVNGLTAAGCVFVAQYYGAGDTGKMKQSFRSLFALVLTMVLAFSALAFFFPQEILSFFLQEEAVVHEGVRYLEIAVFTYLPGMIAFAIYGCMRAVGDMHVPLRCSVISVLLNAVLNYLLILGKFGFPALGVAGVALATLIARLVELLLVSLALKRGNYPFKSRLREMTEIPKAVVWRILQKAFPLMTNEILWSLGISLLFKFYGTRGNAVLTGYAISGTVSDLFFTLFAGMAAATTVLVSTPLGANEKEKAKENAYRLVGFSTLLAVVFGIMIFLSRYSIPLLYGTISAESQEVAGIFLLVQAFMFWVYMSTVQHYFILRAGGDMKHTLMMDSGFMWVVNIPIVAAITYFTSLPYYMIYLASQFTDLLKLFFAHHLVSKEHWVVNLTKERE